MDNKKKCEICKQEMSYGMGHFCLDGFFKDYFEQFYPEETNPPQKPNILTGRANWKML